MEHLKPIAADPKPALQIPERLRAQFHGLERRLWWVDSIIAICGALSSLGLSYLILFLSDRLWDTPRGLRLLLVCAALGAVAYFAWGWMRHWIWRRRDLRALSNLVQRHYRPLGDRLLGIVELADPTSRPGNVSAELCRAAIRQVSSDALRFDFRQAVATRKPRLYLLAALWFLGMVLIPCLLVPDAAWNAFARWMWPPAAVPRYTFVRLQEIPSPLIVAHGEPFEIACAVRTHPFWRPQTASCRIQGQSAVRASIVDGHVVFPIPGQTQPCQLHFRVGDVSRRITVEPVLRPALKSLQARIRYPEYLQYPVGDESIPQGTFSFLEGSLVSFHGTTSRKLAEARMRVQPVEDGVELALPKPVPVREDSFRSPFLELPDLAQGSFTWRDEYGLTSAAPRRLTLQSHPDQPPEADCPGQAAAVAILEEEILEIQMTARDDYGLRDLAMAWECRKRHETNLMAKDFTVVQEGAPRRQELEGTFQFSPSLLGLPPDTVVTLWALAHDYFPNRAAGTSAPFRVFILSHEEHARLIQQELERIMAALEEVTRRQETLKEGGRALERAGPNALASDETSRQLEEQAREQNALANTLDQLARKTSATVREALRNRSIPTSLLEEWTRHAQTMQSLASQQMALAASALSSARNNAADRPSDLAKALELEEEVLRRLLELQKEIGPALDRFLANTLAQRLRRVAQTEARIGQSLQSLLPETIGLRPALVPDPQRQTLLSLRGDQDQARLESRQLQEEISRFHHRTSETNYGTVAREMEETAAVQRLSHVADLIADNVTAQAMSLSRQCEKQFLAWADLLDQAKLTDAAGGGGGGGGGSLSEAALRRLLALLRLRQIEQSIRAFTGILQERKATSRSYREDSILLSIRQNFVMEDTRTLEAAGPSRFLDKAHEAMSQAEEFLMKPQTDEPVMAAETDAINLVEAEILDMLRNAQGSPAAAAMAMMMQMMGMGATPGGNLAGGATDQAGEAASGDMRGATGLNRAVDKTVGRPTRILPAEYRDSLQHYYRAVEELESNLGAAP